MSTASKLILLSNALPDSSRHWKVHLPIQIYKKNVITDTSINDPIYVNGSNVNVHKRSKSVSGYTFWTDWGMLSVLCLLCGNWHFFYLAMLIMDNHCPEVCDGKVEATYDTAKRDYAVRLIFACA